MTYILICALLAATATGIDGGPAWLAAAGILGLIACLAVALNGRKLKGLDNAQPGAVKVETVKAAWVGMIVSQYAKAGWQLDSQSSAKSFLSQARVTLTFRKP